jgi:hypothetical protein
MFEHEESCDVGWTSENLKLLFLNPMIEVVVLASPPVKAVCKSVDLLKLE